MVARTCRDHPRMRGEHIKYTLEGATSQGSSPHARGTHCLRSARRPCAGIIPACAGNTVFEALIALASRGSSPHARGTLVEVPNVFSVHGIIPACAGNTFRVVEWHGVLGIIPACAGNTGLARSSKIVLGDHPRMRGEHHRSASNATHPTGSSPHARGTLESRKTVNDQVGIIPACAGNTLRK